MPGYGHMSPVCGADDDTCSMMSADGQMFTSSSSILVLILARVPVIVAISIVMGLFCPLHSLNLSELQSCLANTG